MAILYVRLAAVGYRGRSWWQKMRRNNIEVLLRCWCCSGDECACVRERIMKELGAGQITAINIIVT